MHISGLLAALVACPLLAAAGMYRAPVIELDAKSFKDVMSKEHASVVAFVAPWCGHCKNLGPEYSAAATSLAPLIPFYTVDCDQDKNKPLCGQYGVQGFPTIKAFPRGSKGAPRDYQGERKRGALVEYAKTLVAERVRKLRVDDGVDKVLTTFLDEKSTLPHALLVHPSAPSIPFLWKVIGHRLSGKAQLGYIRDTPKHDVLAAVNSKVDGGDSARLIYWAPGADRADVTVYDGALKFNALLEWLEAVIEDRTPPPIEKKEAPKKEKAAKEETATQETAKPAETEDAAARRARLQAKMDEIERRDRLRREREAAKRAAEAAAAAAEEEEEGTPVEDAPAAEPEEEVKKDEPLKVEVEPETKTETKKEASEDQEEEDDDWSFLEEGTPVDAPAAEPEEEERQRDEL